MPTHRRVKSKDEELAARDDSFRPRKYSDITSSGSQGWRWRKRRIFAFIAGVGILYFLLGSIFGGGDGVDERFGMLLHPTSPMSAAYGVNEPTGAPPRTNIAPSEEQSMHYYEGRIRFYRLASSLHAISKTGGTGPANRNVLFAASSLKSAANLMPLACSMGQWERNFVHFAIFGRDPMPLEEILEINGVDDDECHIFLHDARSDYSPYSTDKRAEVASMGAMKHINDFMHPQAIIMDDASMEDKFFTTAMKQASEVLRRTIIEVPKGKYADFMWMTKLDSGSLASWYYPSIDILIHAPRQSSGGLLRTIRSLQDADYSGLKPPRLTIELPPDIDTFARRQLEILDWPPDKKASPLRTNTVSLRHRIPSSRITTDEASLRFVEAFYPTNTDDNHVLVLSSQAELSPLYYQYLYYTILEYRYSSYGAMDLDDLLGVSLDVPDTVVDGKTRLPIPQVSQMNSKRYTEDERLDKSASVQFLYGAPTSTATLYFGDKWAVLHNFLKLRLAANHAGLAQRSERLVTKTEPLWMEYFLELIKSKGWYVLHPSSAFLTVHNELARLPEEYARPRLEESKTRNDNGDTTAAQDEPFLEAPEPPTMPQPAEHERSEIHTPLHETLPFYGDLPELPLLPYMDYNGMIKNLDEPKLTRLGYSSHFRKFVGGCSAEEADRPRQVPFLTADDLFCLPDMDIEFADEVVTEEDEVVEAILEAKEEASADIGAMTKEHEAFDDAVDVTKASEESAQQADRDADAAQK